jgi:hypothetical protein
VSTSKIGVEALDAMDVLARRVAGPLHLTVNLECEQFRVDNPVFERLSRVLGERGVQLVLELSERGYGRWTDQHGRGPDGTGLAASLAWLRGLGASRVLPLG